MLNIAICDDNKDDINKLLYILNIYLNNNNIEACIKKFESGIILIDSIYQEKFDIIFLDIYMPAMDGMKVAEKIREIDLKCKIFFLTSSCDHALMSYNVNASHYLLKPIDESKLCSEFKIAIEEISKLDFEYLLVKNKDEITKLFYKNIVYVESKARILLIYRYNNTPLKLYRKMDDFNSEINNERFFQCHKSYLVNLDFVEKVKDNYFLMSTGEKIKISDKFKKHKNLYIEYLMNKL